MPQSKPIADAALLASGEMFSAICSQTVEGIGVADVDGNYVYVNAAFSQMVEYSEAELLEMTVFDLKAERQHHGSFATSRGSAEGSPMLVVLRRKAGSEFLAEIVGKNIQCGGRDYVLGVVRDVTKREKDHQETHVLQLQLLHADKLKSLGVLAGGIAHDFNNLLTTIMGNAELALRTLRSGTATYQGIQDIHESARRAAELAQQMLAYSGKGRFVVQAIDLKELLSDTLQLLRSSISRQIELRQVHEPTTARFEGDVTQIRQIIMNLLTNASEAIGSECGVIILSTGSMYCSAEYLAGMNSAMIMGNEQVPPGEYVFAEVADTGVGMDEPTLEHLFDPFFSTKFTGRGLGMSAVLGILRGHRATISIQSEPEMGSTFRVFFPVTSKAATQEVPVVEPRLEDGNWTGAGAILFADDEPGMRQIGQLLLEQIGFRVLTAADGHEALSLYRKHQRDIVCVLLDLTMPKMTGEEAFRRILQHDPEAKVVLCSGYDEEATTARFRDKGLAGFIHKPYGLEGLRSMLLRVLSSPGVRPKQC